MSVINIPYNINSLYINVTRYIDYRHAAAVPYI